MPTVDTVMQFRGQEQVTPTTAAITNALSSLVGQVQQASQAMSQAGLRGAGGFEQLRQKITYSTDAAGNATAKIAVTSSAVN
mgnify:FL=1